MLYCFDIDGVLADKTSIQKLDCTKETDKLKFEEAVPGLPVRENFVEFVNNLGGVYFLTSREETLRGRTNKWLIENGVNIDYELFMRPIGNKDKCSVLKVAMLEKILYPGAKVMFFDDSPFTCMAVQKKLGKYGVSVCEVL